MATTFKSSRKIFLSLIILFLMSLRNSVTAVEFAVSVIDDAGWIIEGIKKEEDMFTQWASRIRFMIGDTLYFYHLPDEDSLALVSEEGYKKCEDKSPMFVADYGSKGTVFELNRTGSFFFVSGIKELCDKGKKMHVKVAEPDTQPSSPSQPPSVPPSPSQPPSVNTPSEEDNKRNGAPSMDYSAFTVLMFVVSSFFGLVSV